MRHGDERVSTDGWSIAAPVGHLIRAGCKKVFRETASGSKHGRLMLTVLGGLAEFECELIRARTGESRACAVAAGVKMGRPPKLTPHQTKGALRRVDAGERMRNMA